MANPNSPNLASFKPLTQPVSNSFRNQSNKLTQAILGALSASSIQGQALNQVNQTVQDIAGQMVAKVANDAEFANAIDDVVADNLIADAVQNLANESIEDNLTDVLDNFGNNPVPPNTPAGAALITDQSPGENTEDESNQGELEDTPSEQLSSEEQKWKDAYDREKNPDAFRARQDAAKTAREAQKKREADPEYQKEQADKKLVADEARKKQAADPEYQKGKDETEGNNQKIQTDPGYHKQKEDHEVANTKNRASPEYQEELARQEAEKKKWKDAYDREQAQTKTADDSEPEVNKPSNEVPAANPETNQAEAPAAIAVPETAISPATPPEEIPEPPKEILTEPTGEPLVQTDENGLPIINKKKPLVNLQNRSFFVNPNSVDPAETEAPEQANPENLTPELTDSAQTDPNRGKIVTNQPYNNPNQPAIDDLTKKMAELKQEMVKIFKAISVIDKKIKPIEKIIAANNLIINGIKIAWIILMVVAAILAITIIFFFLIPPVTSLALTLRTQIQAIKLENEELKLTIKKETDERAKKRAEEKKIEAKYRELIRERNKLMKPGTATSAAPTTSSVT